MTAVAALDAVEALLGGLASVDRTAPVGVAELEAGVTVVVGYGSPAADPLPSDRNFDYLVTAAVQVHVSSEDFETAQRRLGAFIDDLAGLVRTDAARHLSGAARTSEWSRLSVGASDLGDTGRANILATMTVAAVIPLER